MFTSVFMKTLYDKRWFLVGWLVGTVALFALSAAFYPVIKDSIGDLFKTVPAGLESITGTSRDYATYAGYIGTAVFGVNALMVFTPMAIILGVSLAVGEENSKKLYQLLAQPVSRLGSTLQRFLAGVVILVLIAGGICGTLAALSLAIGEDVPWGALSRISLMNILFTFALFSITFGLAVAIGRRGPALIVAIVWVMGSILTDSFSAQVEWLKHIDWLSALTYYKTSALVQMPIEKYQIIVLIGIGIVFLAIGLLGFRQRDLKEVSS